MRALGKLVKSENHKSNPSLFSTHVEPAARFDAAAIPKLLVYFHLFNQPSIHLLQDAANSRTHTVKIA